MSEEIQKEKRRFSFRNAFRSSIRGLQAAGTVVEENYVPVAYVVAKIATAASFWTFVASSATYLFTDNSVLRTIAKDSIEVCAVSIVVGLVAAGVSKFHYGIDIE